MAQKNPYADENPYDYEYQPFGAPATTDYGNDRKIPAVAPLPGTSTNLESEAMRIKAQELARREAELEKREKTLKQKEDVVGNVQVKNWPVFKPIIYHDINAETPEGPRRILCKAGYVGWFVFGVLSVLNLLVAIISSVLGVATPPDQLGTLLKAKYIVLAALWVVLGVPMHFGLYWFLYRCMALPNVARFSLFFVAYAGASLFAAMMVSGWYESGASGIIVAIAYFPPGGNLVTFILNLIMATLWGILLAWDIYILVQGWRMFRAEKHTLESAKDNLISSVTSGATSLAAAAVTSGMSASRSNAV